MEDDSMIMSDPIKEAKDLIQKCFSEYKEEIPQWEICRGFSLLPTIVAKYEKLESVNEFKIGDAHLLDALITVVEHADHAHEYSPHISALIRACHVAAKTKN